MAAVAAAASTNEIANAGLRPMNWVIQVKAWMPKNAPAFCTSEVIPLQNVSLPATLPAALSPCASEMLDEHAADQVEAEEADAPEPDHAREGQQHADDRVLAASAGRRNSSASEPSLGLRRVRRPPRSRSAAAFQRSGSLSRRKIGIASTAGARPTRNIARQALAITPALLEHAQDDARDGRQHVADRPRGPGASPARTAGRGPA